MSWSEEDYEWKEVKPMPRSRSNSSIFKRKRRYISSESENEASSSDEVIRSRSVQKPTKYRTVLERLPGGAAPLIRCAWTGNFLVWHEQSEFNDRNYFFNAFLSNKACEKMRRLTGELKSGEQFLMMPRSSLWPNSFGESGPTDGHIALFFFPPAPEYEKRYDALVTEMMCDDLAMTAYVEHPGLQIYADLLIFTSIELPWAFRRYQGKFYLWGAFKRCEQQSNLC